MNDETRNDARTDEEIEAAIQAKISSAIAAAVANGAVSAEEPIAVAVAEDGSITVFNQSGDDSGSNTPDPVDFPAMYADDGRESETERYEEHLTTHWGF